MACLPADLGAAHLRPSPLVRRLPQEPHLVHMMKGSSAWTRTRAWPFSAKAAAESEMSLPEQAWWRRYLGKARAVT